MIKQSIKSLLYFLTFIGFTSIGIAQTQIGNDLDAESGKGEDFGGSVSIDVDGDRVAIGDHNNDGTGDDAGHVRAFELNGSNNWVQMGADIDGEAAGDNFGTEVSMSYDGKRIAVGAENNDSWGQIIRKYVNDSALEDYLGASVAISGDYAIAGTPGDDSGGAAYILVRSGGDQTWTQHDKIEASDEAADDDFGISVSISGDYAIVGANGDASDAGSAYIFIRSGTSWSQQAKLTASDAAANDNFGYRVSISGSYAIVGAYGDESNKGSAYIFIRSGTSWSQQQKLTATDGAAGDVFGLAVSISGSYAIIGAYNDDSGKGSAYIFNRSGTTWSQQAKLTASDGAATDNFGISVSIDDEYAIIGAYNDDSGKGSAYIFNRSGTTWTQQSHLRASDQAANDYFGVSVDINKGSNGGHAVVGAYQDDDTADGSGSAYIYKLSSDLTSWRIDKKVVANDPAQGDRYGTSVAIDEDYIAVGAPYKDANADDQGTIYVIERKAGVSAGSAQVFNWTGSSWSQIGQTLLGRKELAKFGVSVSLDYDGDIVAIGAPDLNNGLVRVYKFGTDGSWAQLGSDIVGEASGDYFGISVSLDSDGSHLAVGAENNDAAGNNAGHARVYEYSNNSWSQVGSDIDGEAAGDLFGMSVSIDSDGSHVAIGGEGNDAAGDDAGHARVYEYSDNSWSQLGADIDGEAAGDNFGTSVDLDFDGSHVAIGGSENDGAGSNAGYVRVLEYNGTRWREVGYDIDGDGSDDSFGESVSIDSAGSSVAGGAPGENAIGFAGMFNPIDDDLPDIIATALAADNSYIDITWDEKIYSTVNATGDSPRTSGGVDSSDGNITFSQNGGNATAGTITGIKAPDNTALGSASALVGGETIMRIFMSFTGLPSGVEQIYMVANANSAYDPHANAANTDPRGPITLNDLKGPTMTITAAEGADGFTSDDATLSLTFTSSEATTFFALGDITVTNGALSSFSATSSTVYTATFTPTSDGAVTIDVAADTFSDASSNNNTAADQFNWTYDTIGPTMTITAAEGLDGFTSNDATLSLTFTASEVTNNFTADDITVTNGVISDFSVSSGSSSEIFLNFDGTDDYVDVGNVTTNFSTGFSVSSWVLYNSYNSWSRIIDFDTAIDATKHNSILLATNGITNALTFEVYVDGTSGGKVTANDVLSTGVWMHLVASMDNAGSVILYKNGVQIQSGTTSVPAVMDRPSSFIGRSNHSWDGYFDGSIDETAVWNDALTAAEVIALYNSGSRLDASSNSGNYVSSSSLVGYWKFNEGTGTSVNDASGNNNGVVHGASWDISSRVYTATLTPIAEGEVTIDVAAATFTDASSNNNTAADQFNWFYDLTGPTMTITAAEGADGFSSNDATLSLTFTSNEATSNFEIGDISVSNGTLSAFSATSSTVYTATFTPTAEGAVTIDVLANTFTDASSNNNTAADQFNWLYDISPPEIVFSPINGAIEVALKEKITLTFNEPIRNIDNSALTDDNVDALIRLKTPIHSGTDIAFDAKIDADKKIITIDPTNDFSYAQTIWVGIGESVEDTAGNTIFSAAASFTATDTNRAPVLYTIGNKSTFEDAAFSLVMSATDADLDKVTFAGASSNSNVTVAINDSLLTLYPATNWHGTSVITIIAGDNGPRALTDSESFILSVLPVNDAPTAFALAPDTVKENIPSGMHVGLFTATDVDTGEIFTYNLISGNGSNDADNDKFLIINDTLRTSTMFDYEADDTLVIQVQVKDIGGLSYQASKMVFVKDMPDPEISLSKTSINFGKVIVNRTGKKTISLSSVGLDTIVIDSVVVSGVGYSMDTKIYPVTLAPNLTTDFAFSFYPQVAGTSFGQANYYSNNISGIKQVSLVGEGVNDTIPPVIVTPTTPITSTENQDVAITVNVTDENKITKVNLYYQVGGSLEVVEQATTSNGDGTYTGTVNKDMVGINGLVYYYTATDEYSNLRHSDTLSLDIKYGENKLTSAIAGTAYPNGVPKSKWRLISIPTHIDLNTINETIGDELGEPASEQTWHLYEDKGNANWLEAQDIKIGRGYWLHQRMKDDLTFSVGSGKSVDIRSHTIRIPSGWSLIGNPYPFTLKVSFDHSYVFGPLTYSKNSIDDLEGWDSETNTFSPWEGYAIYNRTSDSVSLVLNPLDQNNIQSSRAVDGWQINISADNREFSDLYNLIGRSSEASEQLDQLDNPEPPKLEQYISLAMDREEWGIELPLTSDIRSMDKINGQWDMYLDTRGINGSISLKATLKGDFPLDASAKLFDPIERKSYDLLDDLDIVITRVNDHYDYPLSVIVGSLDYVLAKTDELISQLPESFSLGQNYPNPFNPVTNIPFTIAVPSYVQISIYNLLGEKVSVLESRWFDMGQFHVQWNGKDEDGNQLSTGVYIYSLESAEFRQAKKLILLK